MNYKPYIERTPDGTAKHTRKSRKTERSKVFLHNKRLHSKRAKEERRLND